MTTVPNKRKLRIFYSCSQKDEKPYIEELEEHLSPLKYKGILETWHSGLITPGQLRENEIGVNLEKADIILLFISPSFFADEQCIQQSNLYTSGARVIPILIKPSIWELTDLVKLQALPSGNKPIELWDNRDQAWVNIVTGINEVVEELIAHSSSYATPHDHTVGQPSIQTFVDKTSGINPEALRRSLLHQFNEEHAYLIGRNIEIDILIRKLAPSSSSRRVALIGGPPGIGKTILALHVGHKLINTYPDAQLLVELRGTSDNPLSSIDVMIKIIRAFTPEVRLPSDIVSIRALYEKTLEPTHSIVVLDDAVDITLIKECLPPEGSALIVTSRNELQLDGALSLTLAGLPPHDAHKMLENIAGVVPQEVASTICSRCNYVPLNIRLAGGILALSDREVPEYIVKLLSR